MSMTSCISSVDGDWFRKASACPDSGPLSEPDDPLVILIPPGDHVHMRMKFFVSSGGPVDQAGYVRLVLSL